MNKKLIKTYLSKKPSSKSFIISGLSLLILLYLFNLDSTLLSANGYLVFEKKEYWRAFTTSLLHSDLTHLAHNAFFFTGLSALLHSYFGFWVYPLLSLLIGGFINIIALSLYPPEVHLVGISGVIYFMASFWLTLYLFIERRQKITVRIVHAVALSLIFFFPETFQNRVSYLAHGLGFAFGIPVAILYFAINKNKIRSKEEWITIEEENSFHLEIPEEDGPSQHALDSSQSLKH